MKISRRNFLKTTALTSMYFSGFGFPVNAFSGPKKNLVIIMLRGGMDGLCALPVKGEMEFEKLRSKINLDQTINLTSDFDLHPALNCFHELWEDNKAAAVHATSIPYTGRSHFDGQNLMESGGKTPYAVKTGWLGRGMSLAKLKGEGLALSLPMPLLLRGIPMNDNYYPAKGKLPDQETLRLLEEIYSDKAEKELKMILKTIRKRPVQSWTSRNSHDLASNAAIQMNKKNGPKVAVFEVNGFDTHAAQGSTDGAHADCLKEIDSILKSLKDTLGKNLENTLILTLTEFGRSVKQNNSNGTEHGYGTSILMAGGLLKKSQIYTDWPGLKKKERFEGRDLNSTIDARSIYASAMSSVFDVSFKEIQKKVFWGEQLNNLSDKLFKS